MDDEVSKVKAKKKLNALFVLACARGYLDDVQGLLEKGADPAAVDKQSVSALHFACGQGRLQVVQFLWSRGVEVDCEDSAGNSPLHYAVIGGKTAVLEFMLNKGAWVEGSNGNDDTVLHIAARKGQGSALEMILEHGGKASLKDVNKRGLTALGEAILAGHTCIASILLKAGARIDKAAPQWPLLHLAVSLRNAVAVDFLISSKCNVNEACSEDGSTSLHIAAAIGDLEAAKKLIKAKADPALANGLGEQASELVSEDNLPLKKLLQTKAPPKPPLTPTKAALPGLTSDLEDFKQSDTDVRLKRILKWADIEDPKQLEKATLEFPLELQNQIAELRKLRQITNIQSAIVELLDDKDFQKLAQNPKARAIVEEVHEDRDAFRKFLDKKPVIELLKALQRFQGVVRANGGHNVPFQSLLHNAEPDYQKKSVMRLKGMKLMMESRQRAAIAAALAGTEAEAKENAQRELEPQKKPTGPPKDGDGASGEASVNRAEAATEKAPVKPSAEEYERMLMQDLPPRTPWSWQKFRQEMKRALMQTSIMFLIAVVILKTMTGRYPWQMGDQLGVDVVPGSATESGANNAKPPSDDYEF